MCSGIRETVNNLLCRADEKQITLDCAPGSRSTSRPGQHVWTVVYRLRGKGVREKSGLGERKEKGKESAHVKAMRMQKNSLRLEWE
jgi:hypothetical protein